MLIRRHSSFPFFVFYVCYVLGLPLFDHLVLEDIEEVIDPRVPAAVITPPCLVPPPKVSEVTPDPRHSIPKAQEQADRTGGQYHQYHQEVWTHTDYAQDGEGYHCTQFFTVRSRQESLDQG